jgi:hypothetical protein
MVKFHGAVLPAMVEDLSLRDFPTWSKTSKRWAVEIVEISYFCLAFLWLWILKVWFLILPMRMNRSCVVDQYLILLGCGKNRSNF